MWELVNSLLSKLPWNVGFQKCVYCGQKLRSLKKYKRRCCITCWKSLSIEEKCFFERSCLR